MPVAPGALVAAGAPLLTVGSAIGTRVRLGLDPADAPRVHAGDAVHLASMIGDRQVASRVLSVDPRADPQTRQASVFVEAPPHSPFASGEAIKGEITVARRTGVGVVPRAAVLYEGDRPYLFVISGGVAHRRDLVLGVSTPDQVEIRQGVRIGEHVALDGGTALTDGMAVREARPAGAGS